MLPLRLLSTASRPISPHTLSLALGARSFSLSAPIPYPHIYSSHQPPKGTKNYNKARPNPYQFIPADPDRFVQGPYDPLNPLGDWANRDPRVNRAGTPGKHFPDPQLFGYPELPPDYAQFRDPHKGWWWKQERRNFGEFVPEEQNFAGILSVEQKPYQSKRVGFYTLGCLASLFAGAYFFDVITYSYPIAVEREYPYDGLFLAQGSDPKRRLMVYRGYDDRDKFEGSQREYYLGPGGVDDEYLSEEEIKARREKAVGR